MQMAVAVTALAGEGTGGDGTGGDGTGGGDIQYPDESGGDSGNDDIYYY